MNVIVVDISGKVDNYCTYLCEAIQEQLGDNGKVLFANTRRIEDLRCGFIKLVNLLPKKYWYSGFKWKRYIKAIEGAINYIYLALYLLFHKVDVVHLQWLPFMEYSSVEVFFVKLIKASNKHAKIVYTHHNLYPHSLKESEKSLYRYRLDQIGQYISAYIVHTNNDKELFQIEFGVPYEKIHVACHGVFEPREAVYKPVLRNDSIVRFLLFGVQSNYKGTDIFIEAVNTIPDEIRKRMSFQIVGNTPTTLYDKYKEKAVSLGIEWIPSAVSYETLHTKINESDVVVFPYRAISQSGALLLAIYFEKYIIPSDLPSFRETLEGFKSEWFVSVEDYDALANQMIKHLDIEQFKGEEKILKRLKEKYSWSEAAKSTMVAYNQAMTIK